MWGANYTGTGLEVRVAEFPSEDERTVIEAFAEQHRFPVEVYVVEDAELPSLQ